MSIYLLTHTDLSGNIAPEIFYDEETFNNYITEFQRETEYPLEFKEVSYACDEVADVFRIHATYEGMISMGYVEVMCFDVEWEDLLP